MECVYAIFLNSGWELIAGGNCKYSVINNLKTKCTRYHMVPLLDGGHPQKLVAVQRQHFIGTHRSVPSRKNSKVNLSSHICQCLKIFIKFNFIVFSYQRSLENGAAEAASTK